MTYVCHCLPTAFIRIRTTIREPDDCKLTVHWVPITNAPAALHAPFTIGVLHCPPSLFLDCHAISPIEDTLIDEPNLLINKLDDFFRIT